MSLAVFVSPFALAVSVYGPPAASAGSLALHCPFASARACRRRAAECHRHGRAGHRLAVYLDRTIALQHGVVLKERVQQWRGLFRLRRVASGERADQQQGQNQNDGGRDRMSSSITSRTDRRGTAARRTRTSRNQRDSAAPDMSWHAMPTKAPVKFGSPGVVASSERMLASNCCGIHVHSAPLTRYAKYRRS